jgi:UTP--glucose-1-phosphate uridylyltransferase
LKGGHLARYRDGRLVLREIAQCPEDEIAAFQDINRYRYFNTNNIWINLIYLNDIMKKSGTLFLPIILNPKTIDPRDAASPEVFQIETAMGAAISLFPGAKAVKVPENRFHPIKKCNELLAVRSDMYVLTSDSRLEINPQRKNRAIEIKLDSQYFGHIDLLDKRFQAGIPSLVDCESLFIEGDVFFAQDVKLAGRVKIQNKGDKAVTIPSGTYIDQNLIFA